MTTELLPDVRIVNGTPRVSSRSVAERFKKLHKNVMRDVRNLIDQKPALGMLNFEHTPYVDPQNGQTYDSYEMDRKGFTLLTMGFTGAEALEWKLQYIDAFDAMEATVRSVGIPIELSAEIAAIRADVKALMGHVREPGQALVTTHASANEIAVERGAKQKGRHGLTVRIGNFLELACRDAGEQVLPGRDGKRMFPRSILIGRVLAYVDALVADHNRALDAQGDLLVPANRRRALAKAAMADALTGTIRDGIAALVFEGELIFFDTTAADVEEGAEIVAVLNTWIGGPGRFVPCIAGERQPGYGPLVRTVSGRAVESARPIMYRVAGPIVDRQPLPGAA